MRFSVTWNMLDGRPQRIGPTTALPGRFTARWEYDEDHTVEMDITVSDGLPACEAIRIERNPSRAPLSGEELRRIPVANWVEFACQEVGMKVTGIGGGDSQLTPLRADDTKGATEISSAVARRRHVDDAYLRDAVVTWREQNRDPRAAAKSLNVSVSQLHRYLKKARESGFAPEYGQRKGND